jgi:uncharacterized membrane protein YeaQ/YmgE (transglycosylase-associated protein family)
VFRHTSGPKSWLISIVIGLIGAVVGWLIFAKAIDVGHDDIFDLTGIVGAITGPDRAAVPVGSSGDRGGSARDV